MTAKIPESLTPEQQYRIEEIADGICADIVITINDYLEEVEDYKIRRQSKQYYYDLIERFVAVINITRENS